jgi:hypothetical protein
MLVRSLNLRRLSYVILSGTSNKYLTQLPSIQEKLVDVLKSSAAPVVQAEVKIVSQPLYGFSFAIFLGLSLYEGSALSTLSTQPRQLLANYPY